MTFEVGVIYKLHLKGHLYVLVEASSGKHRQDLPNKFYMTTCPPQKSLITATEKITKDDQSIFSIYIKKQSRHVHFYVYKTAHVVCSLIVFMQQQHLPFITIPPCMFAHVKMPTVLLRTVAVVGLKILLDLQKLSQI